MYVFLYVCTYVYMHICVRKDEGVGAGRVGIRTRHLSYQVCLHFLTCPCSSIGGSGTRCHSSGDEGL